MKTVAVKVGMAACLLVTLLFSAGCTASSDYMREAHAPQALRATPDSAVVVFVRPSGFARGMRSTILDGRGRFLGDSLPETYFAVRVPPGEHIFIAWAENTAALRASLAPGRTYYIEVAPKMGALSARMHLLAITPRAESWGELRTWMDESKQTIPDEPSGQAYLASRSEDVAERLRRAAEILEEYDAGELADRTLAPADGL
jgi:hypothetical protein